MVQRARLRGKDKISARVRKVVTKTLAKYFVLDIRDDDFTFQIPNKEVAAKAALDSIYKRLTKLRSNVELGNLKGNCLPLWVDQGDGGVVGSTKD